MSQLRIVLRCSMLLVAVFILTTCAHKPAKVTGNPCTAGEGNANRNAPILCVDDLGGTLSVRPDPIVIHEVHESSRQPVMVHWFTRSGRNDLQLEIEPGCVAELKCNGKGKCSARTLPLQTGEARCKYDVWTDRHPRLDPDMIIIRCCGA